MKTKIYYNCGEEARINYQRFKIADGSHYDSAYFTRTFSGRMTKKRWKLINRFCRLHSGGIPVYSDYDCTGRCCGRYFEFDYKQNQVTIKLEVAYDV